MRAWQYLVVLAVVAVAAWLYLSGGTSQVAEQVIALSAPAEPASVGGLRAEDFIYYNDSNYSFSIKYPIGYQAEYLAGHDALVRFSAFNPRGLPEVIDVGVSPEAYSRGDFDADTGAFPVSQEGYSARLLDKSVGSINGREAFLSTINQTIGAESMWTRIAVVNCGEYSAFVTASIPSGMESDRPLVEYMVRSFRC